MIERFVESYGYNGYHNERWPTADHIIPWKVFYVMIRPIQHKDAGEQLRMALGVAHGVGMAWKGKSPAVKSQTRILIKAAYPEKV